MTSDHRFPPGPPPVNGIISLIGFFAQFRQDILTLFNGLRHKYGDVYGFQVGNDRTYMLSHPDDIHEVLVKQASKFYKDHDLKDAKRGLARFLGNGLLTSDGDFWKKQRKLAAPALHAQRIAAYGETMVRFTEDMLASWPERGRLDISREMSRLTMLIVGKTLFNVDVSSDVARVGEAMVEVQGVAGPPGLLPTWIPTPQELRRRRAGRLLDEIVYRFIREWREKSQDNGDLLSMLLLAEDDEGNHMSDRQARDEAITLFLAGHETTANTLNWTWYLLAQHPEVEAKLHAELDTVLGGRPPTLADLANLPYVEMVIKESMRLYPPAWIIGRQAIEDVEIGGYFVPRGTDVNMVIYQAHHDGRWWPEPEAFKPERFSAENEASLNKHAYIPFSAGPRVCIGNSFAMMEARLLLATIAQRYRLSLDAGQRVEMNPMITLNPKGGLPMNVTMREPERQPTPVPEAELV